MGVDVYVFSSIVPINREDRHRDDYYIQLRDMTQQELQNVHKLTSQGVNQKTAELRIKQWYKLEGELDRFYMGSEDLRYLVNNLQDAGIEDAFEPLLSYYYDADTD